MRILVLRWGPQWSWSSPGREVEHLFFVQESQFLHKADRLTLVEPSFLSDGCGHLIDGPAILGHSGPPSHIWSFLPLSCGPALGGEQIVIKENFLEGVQPLYFSSIIRLQNICCWVVIFFFFFTIYQEETPIWNLLPSPWGRIWSRMCLLYQSGLKGPSLEIPVWS